MSDFKYMYWNMDMEIRIPEWGGNHYWMYNSHGMYHLQDYNHVIYMIFLTKINYLALKKFICNIVKKYRIKKITNLLSNTINTKVNEDTIKYITKFIL